MRWLLSKPIFHQKTSVKADQSKSYDDKVPRPSNLVSKLTKAKRKQLFQISGISFMMKSYCILNYLCYLVPYRSDLGCMQGYIEVFKRIEEQSCKTYWRYSSTWSSFSCSFYFLPVPTPFWESLRANLEIQDLDFLQNLIPQGWSSSCVHWVFPLKEFQKRKVSKGRFFSQWTKWTLKHNV